MIRRASAWGAPGAALGVLLASAVTSVVLVSCSTHDDAAPTLSRDALVDPQTCKGCHPTQFTEWSGSMHAYASTDPVFLAMNKRGQRETNGALGSFCVNCHAPQAVRDGVTTDGLNLDSVPAKLKGVTCFFCHTVDAIEGTHNAALHSSSEPVMRGAFADPIANAGHAAVYSTLHDRDHAESAQFCGACHDVTTDHGANIERTLAEWQASVFSQSGGATCAQCHMEQSTTLGPVSTIAGSPNRRLHGHSFAAVDVALDDTFPEQAAQRAKVKALLDTTLQTALCVESVGATSAIRVLVDNVAAGHGVPSGSAQDRRVWFEVVATKGSDVLYQSGHVADGVSPLTTPDADLWLLRECMFDGSNNPVRMFWEAASADGQQLPAPTTFNALDPAFYKTHIVQTFPRGAGATFSGVPDKVTLRVRLQPIGLDVLDDLIASGDLSPDVRNKMPTYDLGLQPILEWTPDAATLEYVDERVPVRCVSTTNFNVTADKTPAPSGGRCSP